MKEPIDECVSVLLLSRVKKNPVPWMMEWRGRRYQFTECGLQYQTHVGNMLLQWFTVVSTGACFTLQLNTDSLQWTLIDIETL